MFNKARIALVICFGILTSGLAADTDVVPYRLVERAINIADVTGADTAGKMSICYRFFFGYLEKLLFPAEVTMEATMEELLKASGSERLEVARQMGQKEAKKGEFTLQDFGWHPARQVEGTLRWDSLGKLEFLTVGGQLYAIDARQISGKLPSFRRLIPPRPPDSRLADRLTELYDELVDGKLTAIPCTVTGFITPADTKLADGFLDSGKAQFLSVEKIAAK